ncbi:MAG: N-acetylneuraminate synthase family protein [Proteobacteria bacterium]|nr:N-acetylneuraminate synthase family protein [Pseudomonadota bacterium]
MPEPAVYFEGREISAGAPVFIIAEAGVNHNGDPALAEALVIEAGRRGADCVKFQTFKAERLVRTDSPKAAYQNETTDPGESQLDMLRRLELSEEQHRRLVDLCREQGLLYLSTPYGEADVDLLESFGVGAYKIASALAVEPVFLRRVAGTGKPVFLSTGMCTLADVDRAVRVIREAGNDRIVLLQCTTNYPSRSEDAHLRAMTSMAGALDVLVGYSDHTPSLTSAVAAVALGACVIERHFTLDKSLPGPDHSSSSDPEEFGRLVEAVREASAALGSPVKRPGERELRNAPFMRRGIYAGRDIPAGALLTRDKLDLKRPRGLLGADELERVLGRPAASDIAAGEAIGPGRVA